MVSPATYTRHAPLRRQDIQRRIDQNLQQDNHVPNLDARPQNIQPLRNPELGLPNAAKRRRVDDDDDQDAEPMLDGNPNPGNAPFRSPTPLSPPASPLRASPIREVTPAAPAPALPPPPPPPSPPPPPGLDRGSGLALHSDIPDVQTSLDWLALLREASLDRAGFSPEQLDALQNPGPLSADDFDSNLRFSLDLFLANLTGSQSNYTKLVAAAERNVEGIKLLSADQLKRQLEQLSGVFAIYSDMCTNGCIGYTGLFKQLNKCPVCDHLRRKPHNGKPYKRFTTFPIGPQIQAQWSSQSGAANMRYCQRQTQEILEKLERLDGRLDTYDDFICGSDYLEAVINGDIHGDDTLLVFSMDSAQLYRMKHSDCWIYIWVILNLDPKIRYKVKYVLPAGSIPGPESPKNIDSFLFPSLYHLAAIQNAGGLRIWDGGKGEISTTRLQLLFVTADSVALAKAAHWVGHLGKFACRIFCGLPGRHKPGAPQYFMSLLRPDGDTRRGTHGDIDLATLPTGSAARFVDNLKSIIASNNITNFEKQRRETGLTGVSIFFGVDLIFPPPFCFTGDLMHLDGLNLPDLLIGLFRGRNDLVSSTDRVTSWDWAILRDKDTWEAHGQLVADAKPYLPKDIERPPRNPAEKISSGYKASEYIVYLYGLCPALLHGLLPMVHWKHFCKLVRALHLLSQRSISSESLALADELLISYCIEFEHLYYQRRMDRLHFVRPSIHFLLHRALETQRVGPMALLAQWVLERTIGNLGAEIRQHQDPYANLAQRCLLRCQMNAFRALVPGFINENAPPSHLSHDIGDGYTLLHKTEHASYLLDPLSSEALALQEYMNIDNNMVELRIIRWGRLSLPNGQIARSLWTEQFSDLEPRRTRITKILLDDIVRIAEVIYFFRFDTRSLAMVTLFGLPDADIYHDSSGALWVCEYPEAPERRVVDAKSVQSVVGMVPFKWEPVDTIEEGHTTKPGRYFMVEKMNLNLSITDVVDDEEDE